MFIEGAGEMTGMSLALRGNFAQNYRIKLRLPASLLTGRVTTQVIKMKFNADEWDDR